MSSEFSKRRNTFNIGSKERKEGKLTNCTDRVSRRQQGKGTRIYDPEAMHPYYLSARIDHGVTIVRPAHAAGAAGMPNGLEAAADLGQQFVVRLRAFEPRVVFGADEDGGHGLGGEKSAHPIEGGDSDLLVGWMRKPAWIDDGWVGWVG